MERKRWDGAETLYGRYREPLVMAEPLREDRHRQRQEAGITVMVWAWALCMVLMSVRLILDVAKTSGWRW